MANIVEQGNKKIKQSYNGHAHCHKCGCEFTYDDSEVELYEDGGLRTAVYNNGIAVSSTYRYNYVVCPQCHNSVKVTSTKTKTTWTVIISIILVALIAIYVFLGNYLSKPEKEQLGYLKTTCIYCGSTAYYKKDRTIWTEDGNLYRGKNLDLYDGHLYVIADCDECGKSFKLQIK